VAVADESGFTRVDDSTWVPSGDLGIPVDDGHWELLGREGEVFKRYGEKVSLPQILGTVRGHWRGHVECYGETDPQNEAGYVLVLAPHATDNEARDLLKQISLLYPRTHWPLRVESTGEFPLLPNGKINREGLAKRPDAQIHWKQRI
jgi:acyl-CoA synthetase (AMP-forming)/AMP-acid ligase II